MDIYKHKNHELGTVFAVVIMPFFMSFDIIMTIPFAIKSFFVNGLI